ncbi:salicylate 1-monooxygenase sala [Xylariaceae sp. FL0804]|nr:salicylate 1-monooxygenase sala [Xylariaceae sp. FL0804]
MTKRRRLAVGKVVRRVPIDIRLAHLSFVYDQGHGFSEIGAGVGFGPNAVRAMARCDDGILAAFERVATHNQWPSKRDVYFDFIDGMTAAGRSDGPHDDSLFQLLVPQGANAVHRAQFMDEMAKLVPQGIAHFRKRLETITEDAQTGRLVMHFHDGTTAEADAVIGCDGIKSRTRAFVVGEDHPSAKPSYSHAYAYRALMPMERAIAAIGAERAQNSCNWIGERANLLTLPIDHGRTLNLVAIVRDEGEWPDAQHLTAPAHKKDAMADFAHFGPAVNTKLELVNDDVDKYALFDLAEHPVPTFYRGRVCISGDAAHATTPYHGAGAGVCIEDSAMLTALLADVQQRVTSASASSASASASASGPEASAALEAAFAAFDAHRRARGHWLVADSRETGRLYQGLEPGVGRDFAEIEARLKRGFAQVWDYDLDKAVAEARKDLAKRLDGKDAAAAAAGK